VYLDTHIVVWLYARGAEAPLSPPAREGLRTAGSLLVSPMVRLEIQYLMEIERVGVGSGPILDELAASLGVRVCEAPFAAVVQRAEQEAWTRDPFDRLIVAQAALRDAPLLTKDETIRAHYSQAVW